MKKKNSFFNDDSWTYTVKCAICGEDCISPMNVKAKVHESCNAEFMKEKMAEAYDNE